MRTIIHYVRGHHVALLALFVALGGTSYAAVKLPANSVGSKQITNRSILRTDLSKKTIASLRGQRGPAGPAGRAGQQGAQGVQGVQGVKGDKGDTGPAGPLVDTLPSGKTLRGVWSAGGYAPGNGSDVLGTISFGFQMPGNLTAHLIPAGSPVPAGCSGTVLAPGAAPGHLCVFQIASSGAAFVGFVDPANPSGGVRYGALVHYDATTAGNVEAFGSWAATAP